MLETDVQVLSANIRKNRTFYLVVDKSRIDNMGIEFEVGVPAQAPDDSPFTKNASRSLKEFWKRHVLHYFLGIFERVLFAAMR